VTISSSASPAGSIAMPVISRSNSSPGTRRVQIIISRRCRDAERGQEGRGGGGGLEATPDEVPAAVGASSALVLYEPAFAVVVHTVPARLA
jgi:hypothetical protein